MSSDTAVTHTKPGVASASTAASRTKPEKVPARVTTRRLRRHDGPDGDKASNDESNGAQPPHTIAATGSPTRKRKHPVVERPVSKKGSQKRKKAHTAQAAQTDEDGRSDPDMPSNLQVDAMQALLHIGEIIGDLRAGMKDKPHK